MEGHGGRQAHTKRSSLKRNIQKKLSMGLARQARPGRNSFRTQLKPSCGSGLHGWQEVVCLLGQQLDTGGTLEDRLLTTLLHSTDNIVLLY